jgi:hypothetical protein
MLRRTRRTAGVDAAATLGGRWADRGAMPRDTIVAVLARNSVASVVEEFDGGRVRTRRLRYAYASDALYLPAWRHTRSFRREPPPVIECHVSELDGLEVWSYVQARGAVTVLEPSDDVIEHAAWQAGLAQLNRMLRSSSRVTDTGGPSYGVLRIDGLTLDGVTIRLA